LRAVLAGMRLKRAMAGIFRERTNRNKKEKRIYGIQKHFLF